ncbi:MAG: protein kinase, partial [Methanobacterium sp.]|nr:protein kinase [Methanobacterium sp.]
MMGERKFMALKIFFIISLMVIPIILSLNTVSAADDSPNVLFDESQLYNGKFYSIFNIGTFGSSSFAVLLEQNGFKVTRLTDKPITSEKLKGYDVLVIMGSARNYTDNEISDIKTFVNNGGGLFLAGYGWGYDDGDQNYSFNKIAQSFGVTFANNEIVADDQHYLFFPNFVTVKDLTNNVLSQNVSSFYFIMGTYLKVTGNSTVTAYSDNDSWADQGYLTSQGTTGNNKKDSNETGGPLPLVSTMEYGKGKVVFMGSSGTFMNYLIYRDNGWKLGLNSINWLAGLPAVTEYQTAGSMSVNIGDLAYRFVGIIILAVILFSGLIYKFRRDKRQENVFTKINTIKNWRFQALIGYNVVGFILTLLIFIPINLYLFDFAQFGLYDPYLGYTLLLFGIIILFFSGLILYNIITKQVLSAKYSYINLVLILLFAAITVVLGDIYGFPFMLIFTISSLIVLIQFILNIFFHHLHGPYLIIEGKEFERLEKLSANALLYEFRAIYTDLDYLGEGGFGRVFKAVNKEGQKVAIKIPKTFDKRSERTFISEVSNWSHLDHPNIVKLYDFKILPIPYIETEYCEDHLEKEMKPLKEAVSIIYEVAKGLEYAHNKHIIHGDIKFSNILVKDGVYKISDWGLSKLKTDESLSLSGATPSYAAP